MTEQEPERVARRKDRHQRNQGHKQGTSKGHAILQAIGTLIKKVSNMRFFKSDVQGLLFMATIMVVIGVLNVYSATFAKNISSGSFIFSDVLKYVIFVFVAFVISVFVYRYDYRKFADPNNKTLRYIMWAVGLSLIAVMGIGTVVNGARRWIQLGPISIQPSELAKLAGIIWISVQLYRKPWTALKERKSANGQVKKVTWPRSLEHFASYSIKLLWPIIAFAGITIGQPDMGTALLILGFPFILMILAGLEMRWVKIIVPIAIAVVSLFAFSSAYRRERMYTWWDPWSHEATSGYQTVQGMIAIGSGGLTGTGFGNGTSKFFYLPEAHTDFAFAVWAQEWGFIGALFLVIVVALLGYFGFKIARKADNYLGSLLATGCTMLLVGQAAFNIAMVCGLLPVTGVPLPFVSYGGSALVVNMMAVALIANVGKRDALIPKIGKEIVGTSHVDEMRKRIGRHKKSVGEDGLGNQGSNSIQPPRFREPLGSIHRDKV